MRTPTVSFVVPCYRLAHLLAECIESILSQSYTDFEVLVMDDCSPDDTTAVVEGFAKERIRHIRNERNLGHLANYNKGISLSRGKYVWLISADDRLRRPYVLERYVRFLESHPNVGFVCCPGIGLQNGVETQLVDCGYFGPQDRIFGGREFISASLRNGYSLLAPSVMARKRCYDEISFFPLDMPHQGDMCLWFRWALECDVAYFAEPMVNYRFHELNIMKDLLRRSDTVFRDEVAVLWRSKLRCEEKGYRALARECENVLAAKYARVALCGVYADLESNSQLSVAECEAALRHGLPDGACYRKLRGKFRAFLANQHWRHGAFESARRAYAEALRDDWRMPRVWLKRLGLLVGLGQVGILVKKKFRRANDYGSFLRAAERAGRGKVERRGLPDGHATNEGA